MCFFTKRSLWLLTGAVPACALAAAVLAWTLPLQIAALFSVTCVLGAALFRIRDLGREEELRKRINLLLRSISEGLLVTDAEGRVVLINPAAEKLLGIRGGDIDRKPVSEVIRQRELVDHLLELGPLERLRDFHIWDDDNQEPRILQARTSPMEHHRGSDRITVLRDVTSERQIDRMKNEFISTAAHELRTPLTTILGYSELLLYPDEFGGFDPERQKEFLAEIYEKAEGLARIVSELLDISRIESGQGMSLERTLCRVDDLVQNVLRDFRLLCTDHIFDWTLEDPLAEFWVDQGKFIQVLENLLSNAVKYSPGGGMIRLSAELLDGHLRFSVADQGIGMTPEQSARIFERFYRVDRSDTAVGGLGLGMSIVKDIITAHGGDIWVDSAPGAGTTVTFLLPTGIPPLLPVLHGDYAPIPS